MSSSSIRPCKSWMLARIIQHSFSQDLKPRLEAKTCHTSRHTAAVGLTTLSRACRPFTNASHSLLRQLVRLESTWCACKRLGKHLPYLLSVRQPPAAPTIRALTAKGIAGRQYFEQPAQLVPASSWAQTIECVPFLTSRHRCCVLVCAGPCPLPSARVRSTGVSLQSQQPQAPAHSCCQA